MNSKKSNRLKKVSSSIILNCTALISGFVFWLCLYWFLHFDTWLLRIVYISLTILITKILMVFFTKLLISFTRSDEE